MGGATSLDALDVGVIELDAEGTVVAYNRLESELSGIPPTQAIGLDFFREVAPCTDVPEFRGAFMRGVAAGHLEADFEYDFNFVMDPVRVQVALRGAPESGRYWVLTRMLQRIEPVAAESGALWARNTARDIDLDAVDPEICRSEPIQLPGAIQPHGGLVVLDGDDRVVAASEQIDRFLGASAETLLGRPAAAVLPAPLLPLVDEARSSDALVPEVLHVRIADDGLALDGYVHRYQERTLCELTPAALGTDPGTLLDQAHRGCRRVQEAPPDRAWQEACNLIAAITGFDRVLGYPMDTEGNGTVVAEAGTGRMESMRGLSFPAGDIPAQARRLYVRNRTRTCPNVAYTPATIVGLPQEEVDLSFAQLRSVSPYHVQYQRNMGVAGSMSLSVVVEGRLAGLLIGQHAKPRRLDHHRLTAASVVAHALEGSLLQQRTRRLIGETRRSTARHLELLRHLATWDPPEDPHADLLVALRDGLGADQLALVVGDRVWTTGRRSHQWAVQAAAALSSRARTEPWMTHHLHRDAPEVADEEAPPGLLVVAPETSLGVAILAKREVAPTPDGIPVERRPLPGASARWAAARQGLAIPWDPPEKNFAVTLHHDLARAFGPLHETRTLLRQVIDEAPVGILFCDADDEVVDENSEAIRILSVGATLVGRAVPALLPGWTGPDAEDIELELLHEDGTRIPVHVHTVAMQSGRVRAVVYLQDLRSIRELERRLREAQRLEESATLAAGLAHDFNNVLAVVVTNARLLARLVETEGKELLDEIRSAADSGRSIAKEMLAFSRSQQSSQSALACDLTEAVESCVRLVSKLAGSDIEVVATLRDEPLPIDLAAGNVQQIVFNLVTNARDAIQTQGSITILTRREADYAVLEVSDTGAGMSEEQMGRVFQPFFTTKPRGIGTGLGLFVIAGLVEGVGGNVSVSSEPRRGTTFTLRFPHSTHQRPERLAPPPPPAATERPSLEVATVLLVEDRIDLQRAVKRLLQHAGYRVLVAASGPDALTIAEEHPPSLVLSDYDMPGMNGLALRDRLHERTDVPFILMSGLALEPDLDTVMLEKPVDPDRLLAVIAEHLVGPPSSPRG